MATYNVINEILKAVNNRLSGEGIFCDLMRASDCVNHGILVDKVEFYGISWKFLTLIKSYIRGRYQNVLTDKINAYDSISSRWKKVTNGVPQGSIVSVLLFLFILMIYPKLQKMMLKLCSCR